MEHKEVILQNSGTVGIELQKDLWSQYSRSNSELLKKKRSRDEEKNDDDKWPSGSRWKKIHLAALHILTGPVERKNVIPEKFLPSEEGK